MFKYLSKVTALALVMAATAGMAHAQTSSSSGTGVPEIDPGSMASALTLLAGGVLMFTDKFRGR